MCILIDMIHKARRPALMRDIASRELTGKQLADKYNTQLVEIKAFVEEYREGIELLREDIERYRTEQKTEVLSNDSERLWVTSKTDRLQRLQKVIQGLEDMMPNVYSDRLPPAQAATVLREYRSYLHDIADELGQLPNRGAGIDAESQSVSYTINGVDMENLK